MPRYSRLRITLLVEIWLPPVICGLSGIDNIQILRYLVIKYSDKQISRFVCLWCKKCGESYGLTPCFSWVYIIYEYLFDILGFTLALKNIKTDQSRWQLQLSLYVECKKDLNYISKNDFRMKFIIIMSLHYLNPIMKS